MVCLAATMAATTRGAVVLHQDRFERVSTLIQRYQVSIASSAILRPARRAEFRLCEPARLAEILLGLGVCEGGVAFPAGKFGRRCHRSTHTQFERDEEM
jgi:hypothetical protein